MVGRTLAHYRITAAIGTGGMGEVYRATDTKLGREVALKVLPPEMAGSPERLERFRREARALAALDHPGIVTVHSVEEADGVHFLTMQLVEGQPLDQLIPDGGMPIVRLQAIASALAEALGAAHDKGIVHRDLKPANVMVATSGLVKVLDFGLAKVTAAEEGAGSGSELSTAMKTRDGIVMGTVPYMSPEQVQGRAVDQRTDVFSLGVILYEMATGRRPFHADSAAGLMSAILRDTPPPPVSLRAGLPERLDGVIERCLEKDPAARFPTARDLQAALAGTREATSDIGTAVAASPAAGGPERRPDSTSGRPESPWIAVLPFTSQSADADLASFASGLTEDITTGLSRFSYLLVISRQSTRKLEGRTLDMKDVGRELGARYATLGSVRKSGPKIRVSVQAVDVRTGTDLWAESFDRSFGEGDVFAVQDEITDQVVATIADVHGVLTRSMAAEAASKPPESLTPYEAVLRWFLYRQQHNVQDHLATRAALERAVELEPRYADAWAGLSSVYVEEHINDFNPRPDPLERALAAAQRAVAADPTNQLAQFGLAQAHYHRKDLGAFRDAAERAIRLNPRSSDTLALAGIFMGYSGDWARGVELTTRAMRLNPHHPGWYRFTTFFNEYRQGHYAEALAIAQKVNMPGYWADPQARAMAHAELGHREAARAAVQELLRLWPDFEAQYYEVGIERWNFRPELVAPILESLRKAGLHVARPNGPA